MSRSASSAGQPLEQAALRLREASIYIGLGPLSDWLLEPDCPVPRCDIRRPGTRRPRWRWRIVDLDAFLEGRLVLPGQANGQDLQ